MAAKGYWVAMVDIADAEKYRAYVAANADPFARYGARFLVRGGAAETMEGRSRSRMVVIEFPDYASALACYRSPEYQYARSLRENAGVADLVVVEGYDGPQPQ